MEVYCPWLLLFILCGLSTGTFPSSAPTNHLFKPSLSTFSSQASQLFQTRCLPVICPHTVSTCIHAKASYSVVPSAQLSPSPLQSGSQLHSQGQAPALDLLFPSSGLSLWIPSPCVVYVCMYVGCGGGGWHRRSLQSPRGSSPLCCCVGTQHFRLRLIWAEDGSQAIMLARSTISTAGRRLLVHESWEWYCFRIPQPHPLQSLWDQHSR